jgi:hypothetical protein
VIHFLAKQAKKGFFHIADKEAYIHYRNTSPPSKSHTFLYEIFTSFGNFIRRDRMAACRDTSMQFLL